MTKNMNIGDKLSYLRRKEGYTQEQIAEVCSVSRQSVSKWETNAVYPEPEKILILSKYFNVTTDYLMDDTSDNVNEKVSDSRINEDTYTSCFNKVCNIELKGWDTPYLEVIPIADKEKVLFFQSKFQKLGCIRKEYIDSFLVLRDDCGATSVSIRSNKQNPFLEFVDKKCTIQMHSPGIKSFIFDDDGYQGVIIKSCSETSLTIEENGNVLSIPMEKIAGIEEI
ncbi:helix-turn-helix domain-containing protein [Clostridium sp. Marseille-P2415]|uniref:helix-turn-helix domain-containing protein n=1 Tax=Clostridium sp. Marseille-P2415 TaxID=1805471 RepID=UPI00098884D1|nr:helix-turn-helix transcriptional regulator [Clostridium sp. Marseille-P2415]